tara:strand:+ start:1242 stop:1985 length:744 start_codon:yes stop_codon:yes gene_type:complete
METKIRSKLSSMKKNFTKEWNASYKRNENNILYPKEEVVKFLNRYIRKVISFDNKYKTIIKPINEKGEIRGLDFGCGTGRQTILMCEFLIDAYGCDISESAIKMAKKNSLTFGFQDLHDKMIVINDHNLPYSDKFFDFTISEACLDSMKFQTAKVTLSEIARVTRKFIYFSVIASDNRNYTLDENSETIVTDQHEYGTIQSYFDDKKINDLIKNINFEIIYKRKIIETDEINKHSNSRYYVVLENSK